MVHAAAQLVDDRGRVILLLGGRDARPLVEDHPLLPGTSLVLFRLRDRCDELRFAAVLDDLTGGLPVGVQLPVTAGVLVGGVEDGPFEEPMIHPARMYSFTKRVSPPAPSEDYPLPPAVKAT